MSTIGTPFQEFARLLNLAMIGIETHKGNYCKFDFGEYEVSVKKKKLINDQGGKI